MLAHHRPVGRGSQLTRRDRPCTTDCRSQILTSTGNLCPLFGSAAEAGQSAGWESCYWAVRHGAAAPRPVSGQGVVLLGGPARSRRSPASQRAGSCVTGRSGTELPLPGQSAGWESCYWAVLHGAALPDRRPVDGAQVHFNYQLLCCHTMITINSNLIQLLSQQ